jgi:DNA polymerase III delta subunit
MKIILIHGNLPEAVFSKVSSIKTGYDPLSITEVEAGGDLDLSSVSLFSEKRLIIFDSPDIKLIEKLEGDNSPELTVLLRYAKPLEKSSPVIKKAGEMKAEIFNFEERNQSTVFPFLDFLGNLNAKAYGEMEKNYKESGGQYLITMLTYFLRRMILNRTTSDYMRSKIEQQKRNFSKETITRLYKDLIETDFKIKRGLIDDKTGVLLMVEKILRPAR